ncbi:MAG: histidinol-phosphate transaminase [Bacteroidia bacterium]
MISIEEILNLIRPNIINLKPYSSARDEYKGSEGIFLDANENAFGSPINYNINRYPDPLHSRVRQKLAKIKKVHPEQIFLGNGSDESIDIILRIFCKPGRDEIIILPPTYGMYEVAANVNDIRVKKVFLDDDFQPVTKDILENISSNTRVVFFCSPNNPTGNLINTEIIEEVLNNFHGIVIVDEAYIDYANTPSWIYKLNQFPNLIVLQTFSKAWGMAGLRAGMAFAHPDIIAVMNRVKLPYNINIITQNLILEALENQNFLKNTISETLKERMKLVEELKRLKIVLRIYPSDANFILVKVHDADKVYNYLVEKKVIVRNRSKLEKCEGCLRITIGKPNENAALISVLSNINF